MKKWKTALIIVSLVLVVSIALYFLPTNNLVKKLPILNSFYKNTTLEVITPNGKANITINDKDFGETPSTIQNLVEGNYDITLTKSTTNDSFYKPQTFNVQLVKNTTARINIELGPEDFVYGTILYYTNDSIYTEDKGKLTVTSNAENSKTYLDKEFFKTAPVTNVDLNPGEYEVTISASDYESLTVPIVIREGLTLNIKGYLLPIPVTFEDSSINE